MVFELETSNSVYSISRYCTFIISSLLMSSSLLMMMMMHSSFQERELYIVHSCTLVVSLFLIFRDSEDLLFACCRGATESLVDFAYQLIKDSWVICALSFSNVIDNRGENLKLM